MSNRGHDESELTAKLKKNDFSRFSPAYKSALWETVRARSETLQLSDDDLGRITAASGTIVADFPPNDNCPLCGKEGYTFSDGYFTCYSCGHSGKSGVRGNKNL